MIVKNFTPIQSTKITASTTNSNVVFGSLGQSAIIDLLVDNSDSGASRVYLKFNGVATSSVGGYDISVPAGSTWVVCMSNNQSVGVITAAGTSTVYLTVGEGI